MARRTPRLARSFRHRHPRGLCASRRKTIARPTEPADTESPLARLARLRDALRAKTLDGLIVPRSDEHLGENVPASSERLAWLTGFTGSAGIAIVLERRAAVFSDGRYVLQLAAETDRALYEQLHVTETPPADWLRRTAAETGETLRIGYDPRVISEDEIARFEGAGIALVPLERNPVDEIWTDRPAAPLAPARPHGLAVAGESSIAKREALAATLREAGQDAAIITDPASVAWLLNIRGSDLPTTPVALGFAVLRADEGVDLFMAPEKLDDATRRHLGNRVAVLAPDQLASALSAYAGKRVRVDRAASPVWFAQELRRAGAEIVAAPDPCLAPKARKNAVEQEGMRDAHRRDAVAMCRFLHWLEGAAGRETEISAATALLGFRAADPSFLGESFPAISGAGEHGAIIHYHATPQSDRPLNPRELFLIDSGGQYETGTTDITRTVWTGGGDVPAAWRDQFTRVLKGHIALATATFPAGVTGHRLDALARDALWRIGLDYDHGTGHGVGSVLSVHEGPVNISPVHRPVPIEAGMVVSDEPGFYEPGSHGIRIENLLLARTVDFPLARRPFLGFETLTFAPIDRRCIETTLLDRDEIAWLDAYHAQVRTIAGPTLDGQARAWLDAAAAPLQP